MSPLAPAWSAFSATNFDGKMLFDTQDVEEATAFYGRVFHPHKLRFIGRQRRLRARLDHLSIGRLSVSRHTWEAQVAIDPGCLEDYYVLGMPMRGSIEYRHGREEERVVAGQAFIAGGAQACSFSVSADLVQLLIRIERPAVHAGWQALTGQAPVLPVCFDSRIRCHETSWGAIASVLQLMAECARQDCRSGPYFHLASRVEDLLVTALLLNQPHSQMGRRPPPAAAGSAQLRKAQEYLLAHMEQAVTLLGLARALDMPARTLQWLFHHHAGMGPMQWLREQRLQAVHAALSSGQETGNVTEIAYRYGFNHLGEFSRRYREVFGETASTTLKKRDFRCP